ncbi:MAG: riboflavin synthase [Nocardioidaceae bacterium]
MFTGIVEELGTVVALADQGDAVQLTLRGPLVVSDAAPGASIAVNGCCLTVVDHDAETFTVDVMRESLDKTSLGDLVSGDRVNLERAVHAGTRLGGHIVQGHVDGTGTLLDRLPSEHWEVVHLSVPDHLARYVAAKGSIAVDGTSLTVVDVHNGDPAWFAVSLIPTTLSATTLGSKRLGDRVNLEVDVIAKYVERLLGMPATAGDAA